MTHGRKISNKQVKGMTTKELHSTYKAIYHELMLRRKDKRTKIAKHKL